MTKSRVLNTLYVARDFLEEVCSGMSLDNRDRAPLAEQLENVKERITHLEAE